MEPVEEKTYQYLLHLVNTYDKQYRYEFVKHSQFFFSSKQVPMLGRYKTNNKLTILADPDIFKKFYPYMDDVKKNVPKHYRDIIIPVKKVRSQSDRSLSALQHTIDSHFISGKNRWNEHQWKYKQENCRDMGSWKF